MQINLTVNPDITTIDPDAASYNIYYARVDNIPNPVYQFAANVTGAQLSATPPYSIQNVPNGQYGISATPVYSDGRACVAIIEYTGACAGIIQLNAVQNNGNIQITYVAPGNVPQVFLNVVFPNGGTDGGAYTNGANGGTILIPIPPGTNGDVLVYMQSICDPETNFYSAASGPVSVPVGSSNIVITSDAAGTVITSINGIAGFSLLNSVSPGGSAMGTFNTFTGVISVVFTGTPSFPCNASLQVNGVVVPGGCQNLPNTNGGTVSFPSATYYSSELLQISFNIGTC